MEDKVWADFRIAMKNIFKRPSRWWPYYKEKYDLFEKQDIDEWDEYFLFNIRNPSISWWGLFKVLHGKVYKGFWENDKSWPQFECCGRCVHGKKGGPLLYDYVCKWNIVCLMKFCEKYEPKNEEEREYLRDLNLKYCIQERTILNGPLFVNKEKLIKAQAVYNATVAEAKMFDDYLLKNKI